MEEDYREPTGREQRIIEIRQSINFLKYLYYSETIIEMLKPDISNEIIKLVDELSTFEEKGDTVEEVKVEDIG